MTKAEKQRVADLEKEVCLARALRWSTYAPPTKIKPQPGSEIITGYLCFGARLDSFGCRAERAIVEAWSGSVTHGYGNPRERVSASQGSCSLYQTKRDALIGLRLEKEREYASILADIDRAIVESASDPTNH